MPQALVIHQAHERRLRDNIALAGELMWGNVRGDGVLTPLLLAEKNEAMRPGLEALRAETGSLFMEANDLKARWAHLEAAQADASKVRSSSSQRLEYDADASANRRDLLLRSSSTDYDRPRRTRSISRNRSSTRSWMEGWTRRALCGSTRRLGRCIIGGW